MSVWQKFYSARVAGLLDSTAAVSPFEAFSGG